MLHLLRYCGHLVPGGGGWVGGGGVRVQSQFRVKPYLCYVMLSCV